MKKNTVLLILLIATLGLSSCSKKAIIRKYYVLEIPPGGEQCDIKIDHVLPYKVDVRDFRVAKAFNQTRIAVRSESHELNYYFYHHWAVRPTDAVSDFVYNCIYQADVFASCSREYSLNADYYITGFIHAIERIQTQKDVAAHIHITFQLVKAKSELDAMHYEIDLKRELSSKETMNAFASAMSDLLAQGSKEFVNKMVDYFEKIEKP